MERRVPMQPNLSSLLTVYVHIFHSGGISFLSLKLVLININLTGGNDPEMVICLYSICQVTQVFQTWGTSVVKQFKISSPI